MQVEKTLEALLRDAPQGVAPIITAIAAACVEIERLTSLGGLAGSLGASLGQNADGDTQKELDVRAQELMMVAMRQSGVAAIASEELEDWELCDAKGTFAVAFDPLDGSSNIDTNMSIGTIFSILPAKGSDNPFTQPGHAQIAAGFAVYGPQTLLVLTFGKGTDVLTLDPRDGVWRVTRNHVQITGNSTEYAVNASNYRHWDRAVRAYVDDCVSGVEGPREKNFNMRWIGSLVAEAFRILTRGGVFLYPGDVRQGYREGRLRLLYEAHPIAFVIEQAGGRASNGHGRILDMVPKSIHQRVPLFFGSAEKVERLERLHNDPQIGSETSPLFGRRGLFRA
ncbi:MAG: class 1 fructose-bisphosphatase [Hyphomicrobiales bacterium]|nr:class 1 fructose-bisphosphatase [Hyphomicrobiales bacterium]MDE2114995.1 class 1 fructose-bisphosphatase [Hyphomicrobiales bacterium]